MRRIYLFIIGFFLFACTQQKENVKVERIPVCDIDDANDFAVANKWQKKQLTYFIDLATLPSQVKTEEIEQAFMMWSNFSELTFERIFTVSAADLKIRFANGEHGDGSPFDGPGRVLAHAFYPPPNKNAGEIHFDLAENWQDGYLSFTSICAHEIGHAIGIKHSEVEEALMFRYYTGEKSEIHDDDKKAVCFLYCDNPNSNIFTRSLLAGTQRSGLMLADLNRPAAFSTSHTDRKNADVVFYSDLDGKITMTSADNSFLEYIYPDHKPAEYETTIIKKTVLTFESFNEYAKIQSEFEKQVELETPQIRQGENYLVKKADKYFLLRIEKIEGIAFNEKITLKIKTQW